MKEKTTDVDLKQRIRPAYDPLINNFANINSEEINIIIGYFEELRTYWKEYYSKSLLKIFKIRPELKPKIDFNTLQLNLEI